MSDEFDAVVERVRERVTPTAAERSRLDDVATVVVDRAEAAVSALDVDAEVVRVGSTARGTWTAGDRDVDVFVCFPPNLEREKLERYGLEVGHAVISDGHEEYAEHPYVTGTVEGYDVDLVPCYAVDAATEAQSAVDRTPFHTRYVEDRIDDELAADVRVCKQFGRAVGVYGSDLKTRGFSGYLTELLVIEYGGFRQLIETAATDWHPPVHFDPEGHGEGETTSPSRDEEVGDADLPFDDPLVVVDPTDPERNVAAVVTAESVARFQHYARELLGDPREDLFEPSEPGPLNEDGLRAAIDQRGTTPVAVRFDAPDLVDDQLWPQLARSLAGVTSELDRRGFDVLRAEAFADDSAVLFVELEVVERPAIERHEGPPVHVREHARGFYEKYADSDATGPYLEGDRYVVERERESTSAATFLRSDGLLDVALGAHVESALEDDYEVLVGADVATLADEFGVELARYFDPKP